VGTYDLACSLSGLPLQRSTALLLMKDRVPIATPLYGAYDEYGGVTLDAASITSDALCAAWQIAPATEGIRQTKLAALSKVLRLYLANGRRVGGAEATGGLETWLVHAGVYRAIAETVLSGSEPQWQACRREALEAMTTDALMQAALPLPDSQELYGALSSEQLRELRPDLMAVLAFQQWPEPLQTRECLDQYYSKRDLEKALAMTQHWRRHPRLAAAVDEIAATCHVFDD
jgi:hypothetical protein